MPPMEIVMRMRWQAPTAALALALTVVCAPSPPPAAPRSSPPSAPPAGAAATGSTPSAPARPAAAPLAPVTVKVGLLGSVSDAGVYVGDERGYYRQQGIEISYEPYDAATSIPTLS